MEILLVCAGGMSTSILMNKVEKWSKEKNKEVTIAATGIGGYGNIWEKYDVILIAPQVSYRADEIKESVSIPVTLVPPFVYGMGDPEKIYELAVNAIEKEKV